MKRQVLGVLVLCAALACVVVSFGFMLTLVGLPKRVDDLEQRPVCDCRPPVPMLESAPTVERSLEGKVR